MKRNWVQIATAFSLVACMAMSAAACSSGSSGNSGSSAAESGDSDGELPSDVTLTLWTDQSIDTDQWQEVFSLFAEEYSDYNYSLSIDAFAGSDRATKMSSAIESNSLPDMGLYAWFTDTDWCHQGYVLNISDIVDPVEDQMDSSVYEETRLNGGSYMLPLWSNYYSILYNADMLRDAGLDEYIPEDPYDIATWTLDEFETIISAVSANLTGEQYGLPLFAADNQADTVNIMFLSMYGGEMWKDGLSNAGSDENVIAALETMGDWVDSGYTNSDVVSRSHDAVPGDFTSQVTAFDFGYYSNYVDFLNQMDEGSIDTFDLRIAAFPQQTDDGDTYKVANYVYGISAFDTQDEDRITVTKLFLDWLANNADAQKELCMAVSPFESIATDSEVLEANPVFAYYNQYIDEDHIMNFHGNISGYVSTRSFLYPALQSFFSGDATAEEALQTYSEQSNEVIQEFLDNSIVLNS